MSDLFDYAKSVKARNAALASVLNGHNPKWAELVLAFIEGLPKGWRGIGEDIRRLWHGPQPDHVNAWGAVIRVAVAQGLLEETGEHRPMTAESSHARESKRYRRT